ncbi:MAG TPA: hypothetical protein PLQ75_09730 [Anaerolineales bacterium]|nr:hypothetical protein [Anaerolineales bacterium]HNF94914.1 hypothetical protein [Anaerolineales bacterium]
MFLLMMSPILSIFVFSIAPFIGGYKGYKNAREDEDKIEQAMKGIGIGVLIDIPFLCVILALFSTT